MAIAHAQSGEKIDLLLGAALPTAQTTVLAKTAEMELIRLVIPAGKAIPEHRVPGPITVQCLEGRVLFAAGGKEQELVAGQMLRLIGGEPHAVQGLDRSSLLVTIWLAGPADGRGREP